MTIQQETLDYLYHEKCYQLIGIYLPKETDTSIPQQIIFIGKLKKDNDTTMFFCR